MGSIAQLSADARAFIEGRSLQKCSFQGPSDVSAIEFWLNPFTFRFRTERIHLEAPTINGVVRFSYGTKPYVFSMDGITGLGGLTFLKHWDSIRPLDGQPDTEIKFRYPARFQTAFIPVYINWIEDSILADLPLFYQYSMEFIHLEEFNQEAFHEIIGSVPMLLAPNLPAVTAVLPGGHGAGGPRITTPGAGN